MLSAEDGAELCECDLLDQMDYIDGGNVESDDEMDVAIDNETAR
jgi:hypothetical protein